MSEFKTYNSMSFDDRKRLRVIKNSLLKESTRQDAIDKSKKEQLAALIIALSNGELK